MEDNNKLIEFGIKGIFVSEFNVKICDEFIKANIESKDGIINFTFEISCVNKAAIPDNLVHVLVNIKVYLDEEKKIQLGNLSLTNIFFIKNLDKYANKENNTYSLPENFEVSLISISISHTRAILLAKCAGTFLQNAVLPIVDPKTFVKKAT
ncbi:MAG: hypothetical protein NTV87_12745 [Ignavibacteriae bacterium]|nr:hypothetical protein [Ignavibacteriota bacterium]